MWVTTVAVIEISEEEDVTGATQGGRGGLVPSMHKARKGRAVGVTLEGWLSDWGQSRGLRLQFLKGAGGAHGLWPWS